MAINTTATDNINKNISTTNAADKKLQTNYQDFLKLLTVQLQNQDPSAPTDTNQLTQQIASLSQVEQQISTNKNLEKLINLFNVTSLNSVVSYIGKQVETAGDKGALQGGVATFVYNLAQEAETVEVTISDAAGKTVLQGPGTKLAGRNELIWPGKDTDGNQMKDGTYTIKVAAKDAGGTEIKATTYTVGTVSSVDSKDGTATLSLGDIQVSLDKVLSVRQPGNV